MINPKLTLLIPINQGALLALLSLALVKNTYISELGIIFRRCKLSKYA